MQQIKKLSTYLLYVLNAWIIFKLGALLAEWIFLDTPTVKRLLSEGLIANPIRTPEGILTLGDVVWTNLSKAVFIGSTIIGSLPFFLSLFVLRSVFKGYQRGEIFNVRNAISYRRLGYLLFFDALFAKPISECLTVLAVTLSNGSGHRYLTLSFGNPNLEAIFWGVIVIVISWVMGEASRLQEDQHLTI